MGLYWQMPKLKTQFVTFEIEVWLPNPETLSLLSENYLCDKQIDLVMKKAQPQTNFKAIFQYKSKLLNDIYFSFNHLNSV